MNLGIDEVDSHVQGLSTSGPRAALVGRAAETALADARPRESIEPTSFEGWPSTLKVSRRLGARR
jgi:hypothetical protein